MAHQFQAAITEINKVIETKLRELAELKRSVNALCHEAGIDPLYPDAATAPTGMLRPDSYYSKPLATAIKEFLESRRHAAPVQEILGALEQGGFDFDTTGWNAENRLRNLAISISKNPAFKRLPSGVVGLKPWYDEKPGSVAKTPRSKRRKTSSGSKKKEHRVAGRAKKKVATESGQKAETAS